MSKLNKLKSFLQLDQVAMQLSAIIEEPVSVADVLQLVLDKQLTLSINFINPVPAQFGKITPHSKQELDAMIAANNFIDEVNWWDDISAASELEKKGIPCLDMPLNKLDSIDLGQGRWLSHNRRITQISGIWDLAMIGDGPSTVMSKYQALIGGPRADNWCSSTISGIVLERQDGKAAILMEPLTFEPPDIPTGTYADYERATRLPYGAQLCVRPVCVNEFEARHIQRSKPGAEEDLKTRQKRTFQTVIAACCFRLKIDWQTRSAAKALEELTEHLGAKVDQDTIKRLILDGMEDAVQSRTPDNHN